MQRTLDPPWLRHIDDATRATVHRIVGQIVAAIDGAPSRTRLVTEADRLELIVKRRVGSKNATSSARCILDGATLEVRVPAKAGWSDDVLSINGPVPAQSGSHSSTRLRATLEDWRAGLAAPIGPDEERAAAEMVDGCAVLLRASAQTLDPAWSAAAFAAFGPDVLAVLVEFGATASTRPVLFSSDQAQAPGSTVSPELVRAFAQVAGPFVHVTRLGRDPRHLLPRVQIGLPPRVRVINDGDAMSTIRAVAALPPGARLVATG